MKLHHSRTTQAKGKNGVLLHAFGPVTVAAGEQVDGHLLLADINSRLLSPILSPMTPRELKLHPPASTSKRNKQAYGIYFSYLLTRYGEKYRMHLLPEVRDILCLRKKSGHVTE